MHARVGSLKAKRFGMRERAHACVCTCARVVLCIENHRFSCTLAAVRWHMLLEQLGSTLLSSIGVSHDITLPFRATCARTSTYGSLGNVNIVRDGCVQNTAITRG